MLKAIPKAVKPIQRTSLSTAVFEQLIGNIVNGTWKAGDRLPTERDLCQQFGVARTSLREALKAMELVGMLNSRVGDGTFVCPRSEFLSRPMLWALMDLEKAELHDVMDARLILEAGSAGLAAERATRDQIDQMAGAIQAMRDCIARDEPVLDADLAFHLAISAAAANPLLTNSLLMLRNLIRQGMLYKHLLPGISPAIVKEHTVILTAIKGKNPEAASKAMRQHLERSRSLVDLAIRKHHVDLHAAAPVHKNGSSSERGKASTRKKKR